MGLRAPAGALALALLLAACAQPERPEPQRPKASAPSPARTAAPNLSGFSPDFKAGYADGCASAGASMKRDPARFETGGAYARGWQDGFSICKR